MEQHNSTGNQGWGVTLTIIPFKMTGSGTKPGDLRPIGKSPGREGCKADREEHIQEEKAVGYRACFKGLKGWGFIPAQNCTSQWKTKQETSWRRHWQATPIPSQSLSTWRRTKVSLESLCFAAMWKFDKWSQWKVQERDSNQPLQKQNNSSGLESSSSPQFYSVPPIPPQPCVFRNFLHFFSLYLDIIFPSILP